MTLLLRETFTGTGELHGKSPDVADPAGHTWVSTDATSYRRRVVMSGGYAVNASAAPVDVDAGQSTEGYAHIVVSGLGAPASSVLSFGVLTGAVVSVGEFAHILCEMVFNGVIDGGADAQVFSLVLSGDMYYPGWSIQTNVGGEVLDTGVMLAANTLYPCTLSFSGGVWTFEGFGQSLVRAVGGAAMSYTKLLMAVGFDTRIDALSLSGEDGPAATSTEACAAGPSVLGVPAVLSAFVPAANAHASALSMMGAPAVLAALPVLVNAAAPSMLGAPSVLASHDFTGAMGDAVTLFVMDLIMPTGTARIPISSWQATLQTGSSNYVQCVIPACTIWVSAINSATEFVIYRRAVLPDGGALEYEMARAPAEQAGFDRGPERHTCTLSGYSDAFAASEDPRAIYDRTLTGVRSISSGSSYRVRCAVDWLLRPGHRAFVEGAPFVVGYINYYAPSGFDCYMDVGG